MVDVLTFEDIAAAVEPRPIPVRLRAYSDLLKFLQYPLAHGKVHYVGDPVAVVLAESRYLAEDAVEAVAIEYEPLAALVDVKESLKGETLIHEAQGTNVAFEFSSVNRRSRYAAFRRCRLSYGRKSFAATGTPPTPWRREDWRRPTTRGGSS